MGLGFGYRHLNIGVVSLNWRFKCRTSVRSVCTRATNSNRTRRVLEPELFFLLFISPLLYYDGVHAPRFELWRLRRPILVFALGLVFVTVFIVGYIVHWLIPSIPLAAGFGLAAILSPTDTLAVTKNDSKLSKRSQGDEMQIRIQALNIERNHICIRMENGTITREQAEIYYRMLGKTERMLTNQTSIVKRLSMIWKQVLSLFAMGLRAKQPSDFINISENHEIWGLKIQCSQAVVSELSVQCKRKSDDASETVLDYYRTLLEELRKFAIGAQRKDKNYVQHRRELHWIAVQAERDAVQKLFENGDINREFASYLRKMIRNRESTLYEIEEMSLQ